MTRIACLLLCVATLSCAQIEEPSGGSPPAVFEPRELDETEACIGGYIVEERGAPIRLRGGGEAVVQSYHEELLPYDGSSPFTLGVYVAGSAYELRGAVQTFDSGDPPSFDHGVHYITVTYPGEQMYLATAGGSASPQVATAAGEPFYFEASYVELSPVIVDAALGVVVDDSRACLSLPTVVVTGSTADDAGCNDSADCNLLDALQQSSAQRHPAP